MSRKNPTLEPEQRQKEVAAIDKAIRTRDALERTRETQRIDVVRQRRDAAAAEEYVAHYSERAEYLERKVQQLTDRLQDLDAVAHDKTRAGAYVLKFSLPFEPAALHKIDFFNAAPVFYSRKSFRLMSEIFAYADSAKNAPVGRDDRPLPWKTVDGITTRANLTIEAGYPVPQSTNDAMTQAHLLGAIEPSEPCGAIDLLYVVVGALTVKERYVVCKPDELSEWEKRLPPFLVRKYRAEAIDPIIAGYHALGGNVSIRRYYTTTPTLTVTLDVTYQVYKF